MARRDICEDGATPCRNPGGCGTVCCRPPMKKVSEPGTPLYCEMYIAGGILHCYHCENTCGLEDMAPVCQNQTRGLRQLTVQLEKGPEDYLRDAAKTFAARNAVYKDGYKRSGQALLAIFPEDGIPAITTPEAAQRLRMIQMCVMKLQRYCANFQDGGHPDSAEDLIMYAAFLRKATK